MTLPCIAHAQDRQAEYSIDISRQAFGSALQELCKQTGCFYGYVPASAEEERTLVGPVRGRLTVEAALVELLRPVGLTFSWVGPRNLSIERPAAPGSAPGPPTHKPSERRAARQPASAPQREERARSDPIEKVIVTASMYRSLGLRAAPVEVLERDEIERSGAGSVTELLRYISQQPYLRPESARTDGAQYAELRGLGADNTLILINGRRTLASAASFTANAFDLNTVPLSAVERVEVLLDSASVVYGTDAIGGIVNIILRDEIAHPVIDVHYGTAQGGGEQRRASVSMGYGRDGLKSALVLDYYELDSLLGEERELWRDQDYRRFGSVDQRSMNASPGNISSVTGANLPGLPASVAAIPDGPVETAGDLLPGQCNAESLFRFFPIVPQARRMGAAASAEVRIAPDLLVSAELLYVDRAVEYPFVPPLVPGLPMPASNPFNVLGETVLVHALLEGMQPQRQLGDSTLVRGAAALNGKLAAWQWELSLLRSEEDARSWLKNALDPLRLEEALAQSDPNLALDVFGGGPAGSPQLLESLIAPPRIDTFATDGTLAAAYASGPVLKLPAGDLTAVVGAQWRSETVQFERTLGPLQREAAAGFAEVRVPLFGPQMQVPALHELTVTLAGRIDDYSDFGSTFNPQYGLIWRPYRDLALRASYGRSFRPASMYELFFPKLLVPAVVFDPRREDPVSVVLVTGGNPDLRATRGESLTAGFVFSPRALEPFELGVSYWQVAMDNRVTLLPPALLLENEAQFADRIVREQPGGENGPAGGPGTLLQIDISRLNFGRLETAGVDVSAAYELHSTLGRFAANLTATWIERFDSVDLPGIPATERVNVASALGTIPKWRAVAALDWRHGPFGAATHLRYVPAYEDTFNSVQTGRRIGGQTILDAQLSVDLHELSGGAAPWRGLRLTAGAINLFDRRPHFAEVGGVQGYDTSQGDLRGRFGYVRLDKSFW